MPVAGEWRSRPVFIASTFRDMDAERDYLQHFVFPELAERLRERRYDLVPIDLRWGVETLSVGEEHAKELLVLKVCLGEIERSRPFFLGLVGDRYGWVPPEERMRIAAQEAGFETDVVGKSVTALEIEYGALTSPDRRRRCLFYLRDPLPYGEMDPETAALWSDAHALDPNGLDRATRLVSLKARIEAEFAGRVRHYRVDWDSGQRRVTGLEGFGRQVLEDLWRDLDDESARFAPAGAATWQDKEGAALEEFLYERRRDFVGRESLLGELVAWATGGESSVGEENWGTCVVGKPGAGKSALVAVLYRLLRQRSDTVVLAHSAGISARSASVDLLLRRWVEMLVAQLGVSPPVGETPAREDLERTFAELLSQTSATRRVVVLLDALNQFERTSAARYLTWLPEPWPQNARLVATALEGTEAETLSKRGVRRIDLAPLTEGEARDVITAICARYHRAVHEDVTGALVAKRLPQGALAAGNPLWLQLALEELLLLDADDFARLGTFTGTPEQQLHALLLETVERLPSDVASLYTTLLARTEATYGQRWARGFVDLLALCRAGLRESDLRLLLPKVTLEPWEELRLAALRRGFRVHLVERGSLGQWDFSHAQAREAVLERNLANAAARRRLHRTIADHLMALPEDDPLRESELMHHFIAGDDQGHAARHYSSDLSKTALDGATQAMAAHIISAKGTRANSGLEWVCALLDFRKHGSAVVHKLCRRYSVDLCNALGVDTSISDRIALVSAAEAALTELNQREPPNNETVQDLAVAHAVLGELRQQAGNLAEARAAYGQALFYGEKWRRANRGDAAVAQHLVIVHSALGELARQAGSLTDARAAYQQALFVGEGLYRTWPGGPEAARTLAILRTRLGDIARQGEDPEAARDNYQQAALLFEELHRRMPHSAEAARDLAVSHHKLGVLAHAQGDLAGARAAHQQALIACEGLYRQMPDSAEAARDVSVGHEHIADVAYAQGDLAAARAGHEQALSLREELYVRMPYSAQAARDFASILFKIAHVLEESDPVEARRYLLRSRDTLHQMGRAGMSLEARDYALLEHLERSVSSPGDN